MIIIIIIIIIIIWQFRDAPTGLMPGVTAISGQWR